MGSHNTLGCVCQQAKALPCTTAYCLCFLHLRFISKDLTRIRGQKCSHSTEPWWAMGKSPSSTKAFSSRSFCSLPQTKDPKCWHCTFPGSKQEPKFHRAVICLLFNLFYKSTRFVNRSLWKAEKPADARTRQLTQWQSCPSSKKLAGSTPWVRAVTVHVSVWYIIFSLVCTMK